MCSGYVVGSIEYELVKALHLLHLVWRAIEAAKTITRDLKEVLMTITDNITLEKERNTLQDKCEVVM